MDEIRIAVFADRIVGKKTLEFLLQNFPDDVCAIICTNDNSIVYKDLIENNKVLKSKTFFDEDIKYAPARQVLVDLKLTYMILAWWPFILKEQIIAIPSVGVINFHPSYLPYNRGMNYNFWTLIEDTPFGVSLHFVDNSIDGGDIIFQEQIEKTWTDTGASLYQKAQSAMLKLFKNAYIKIRNNDYIRVKQNPLDGSFHYSRELIPASQIDLEKSYKAKDLLNILRARTFPPHPGAWFIDKGEKYEIKISIEKVNLSA